MNKYIYTIALAIVTLSVHSQDLPVFTGSEKLSENVNSEADEVKPVLNSDGTIMYLTRSRHKDNASYDVRPQNQDIWETLKDENGEWKIIEHETSINDKWDNSIIGRGKSNHYFLLNTYQSSKNLDYGIAQTTKNGEHDWSKPEIIKVPKLKYDGNFYDFYVTHDESIMIISIKGEDSKGAEDLYFTKSEGGKWSDPVSLGDKINTSGYEMSPFLTEDKKYLYFSSNGREGLGNADVFVSERLDDTWTNWSKPQNLGKGVNSSKMDCYFTMSDNGDYYFSSNREGSQGLDIYQAIVQPPMVALMGNVFSSVDSSKIEGTVTLSNKEGENQLENQQASSYNAEVPNQSTYTLEVSKEEYVSNKLTIDLMNTKAGETVTTNIYLTPIVKEEIVVAIVEKDPEPTPEKPIILKRVLHPYDQASHTSGTGINIDDVIKAMKDYPFMVIQIESHTDSKGSDEYNMALSKRRASSAKTYLIRKGISGSRLKVKWYGETKAISPNTKPDGSDSPNGRAQNRRTEFKIISNKVN